jgi:hypothetical protein
MNKALNEAVYERFGFIELDIMLAYVQMLQFLALLTSSDGYKQIN